VIIAGLTRLDTSLWTPFMPEGVEAVIAESATLFFAYVGFDAVANSAEECRQPSRDIPAGICISLAVCAALYVGVVIVLSGLVYYKDIDQDSPLSSAFESKHGMKWVRDLVDIGGLIGLTTTLLIGLYAQARVYLGMARDGVLPTFLSRVHRRFHSPAAAQLLCGGVAIFLATLFNVHLLASLLSIGVMTSYSSVCAAVLCLRSNNPSICLRALVASVLLSIAFATCLRCAAPVALTAVFAALLLASILPFLKSMEFTEPDLGATFACPFVPYIPWLGLCSNVGLMVQLPAEAWIRFGVVTLLALGYFEWKQRLDPNAMARATSDPL
jgi:APA family basic amino acid/polyamine antiporter